MTTPKGEDAQGAWFDPTILEIVTEYAEWRDASVDQTNQPKEM